MVGLKELWDLGDPAAPDSIALQQLEQDRQAFTDSMNRLNISLQYTAANALQTSHDELAWRRDELYQSYQLAAASQGDDPEAMREVLAQAEQLHEEAEQLAELTRKRKERWEKQTATLESTEDAIAQTSDQTDEAAPLRRRLNQVAQAAKQRDYQAASDQLDALASETEQLSKSTTDLPRKVGDIVNERRFELKGKLDIDPVVPIDPNALASWENPLVDGDPSELFKHQRMDEVVGMQFAGQGTPELNEAMKGLLFAEPGENVARHLAEIGRLRGLDIKTIEAQFSRFRQLQDVAQQLEQVRGLPPDEVMTARRDEYLETHGEFLGTRSSLRFGQVVGEATGLDPAFAAMLNPTGGMVGPGMDVLAPTDVDSPVIWHGIFHDASGYLLNHQNTGPGYTYLEENQPDSGRRGADPLQGQVEGVSYWYQRRQPDRSVLEDLYEPSLTAEDPKNRQLAYDRIVRHPVEDVETFANGLTEDAVGEMRQQTGEVRQVNQQSVEVLKNTTRAAREAVQQHVHQANETLDEMANLARELGVDEEAVGAAQVAIHTELQSMHKQVDVWEQDLSAEFDQAGALVEQNLQHLERWTVEAGAALEERTSGYADDVDQAVHDRLVELAQDKDVQENFRLGINSYAESKQDVEVLVASAESKIEYAKSLAEEFYNEAIQRAGQPAEQLAGVKDDLIDKLAAVQNSAANSVEQVDRQVDQVTGGLSEARQNILDAGGGVADSMVDVVSAGTDTVANAMGSATKFAAEKLASLTTLLS